MFGIALPVASEFYSLHHIMDFLNMSNIPNDFQTFCSENFAFNLNLYLLVCKFVATKRPSSVENTGFSYLTVICWQLARIF